MSTQNVLWVAIVLFAIAAAGGLVMAGVRAFGGRNPPAWLAMLHGLLAGAGLTLLLFATFTVGVPTYAIWAVVLFIIAALGGMFLNLGYQEKRTLLPKPVMYVHALIAVVGFVLLIMAAVGG
jgi:glucose uptake protein GlcU